MLSKNLRAAATALLLGTATVAVGTIALTVPAEAGVRAAVGKPLKDAVSMAESGNYKGAQARVEAAEAVGGLSSDERAAIDRTRQYIAAKSGSGGGGGKGKLAQDWNSGRYREVIQDGDELRRGGGLDELSRQVVAQAYYKLGDYKGCTSYIRNNFSGASEQVLQLQQRCAYEAQDNEGQRTALEQLVQRTNKPEYWAQLLDAADGTKGLSDHQTLDIYRLRLMTGSLRTPDQYLLLAQLALQLGFASESQGVVQKGLDAKVLQGDRAMRLFNMAKGQAGANAANAPRALAGANGDTMVRLGEDAIGQGRAQDAIKLIQAGIGKGVSDKANAQIRLGQAYLAAGQKDQAVRAFTHVDGDAKAKVIAHLWEIYARTH